ncbi:MAG TPA: dihydrofolate reductase family protein [Puia sp.]
MRKLIVTEWLSLDGIFDAGSMNKWWLPFDSPGRQQFIQNTINNCDIMLYGRHTYEMLFPYWSSFKDNEQGVADRLNNCRKYVLSSTLKTAPWQNTTIISKDLIATVKKLKKETGNYILVQGSGSLIKPLLEAGLVDEMRLLINPAIIGDGARLFPEEIRADPGHPTLQLFDKNVVLLTYQCATS